MLISIMGRPKSMDEDGLREFAATLKSAIDSSRSMETAESLMEEVDPECEMTGCQELMANIGECDGDEDCDVSGKYQQSQFQFDES